MTEKTLAFASDHAGYALRLQLQEEARAAGWQVLDLGAPTAERSETTDFPEYAHLACEKIRQKQANFAILICGTGFGMAMAANRQAGIRAAAVHSVTEARLAREHNDANVLCLGARMIGSVVASDCLQTFLTTAFLGGRYQRRVEKLG